MKTTKQYWRGRVVAVQPRIRLLRTHSQRQHNYLGYVLHVQGTIDGREGEFSIGIGKGAQEKQQFRAGDTVKGQSLPVQDSRTDTAEYYKTSGLKIEGRAVKKPAAPPPWTGTPPALETCRERGHRRLSPEVYAASCLQCIWGCRMPVEITLDYRNPGEKAYRFETFCYGPKSCSAYKPGPNRTVPGRGDAFWVEPDRVDAEATEHRGADE
ncbi:hypothetical protein ACFL43_03020 [Thermodesulfobacteriota bacterium]